MLLRCRTCGHDQNVPDEAKNWTCENCEARFSVAVAKVIERPRTGSSDPLEGM
jgi:transcription elongation factor Elf1